MVGGGRPGGVDGSVALAAIAMRLIAAAMTPKVAGVTAKAAAMMPLAAILMLMLMMAPADGAAVGAAAASVTVATGAAAGVGAQDLLEAIDSCVRQLNPDIDIGYERIVARCPNLVRRLDESRWSVWLPRDWRQPGNDLSAAGLRELRELVSRELTSRERARAPSVARVPDVLASLARTHDERSGLWGRTKAWLRDFLERREQATDDGWITRMVGQNGLSQAVIELTSYVALTLVVLLAVSIVFNELRVSGVLGGLRRRATVRAVSPVTRQSNGATWEDVQRASPLQRPRLLLELLVARLTEQSYLKSARGLTIRELTRAAVLPDEKDRDRLAELARTSERVRFSNEEVPKDAIAAAVEGGRLLLERIPPRATDFQGGGS
jgi:hypothetical protein